MTQAEKGLALQMAVNVYLSAGPSGNRHKQNQEGPHSRTVYLKLFQTKDYLTHK